MKVENRIPLELEGLALALTMLTLMAIAMLNFQSQVKSFILIFSIIFSSIFMIDLIIRSAKIKQYLIKIGIGVIISLIAGFCIWWMLV